MVLQLRVVGLLLETQLKDILHEAEDAGCRTNTKLLRGESGLDLRNLLFKLRIRIPQVAKPVDLAIYKKCK